MHETKALSEFFNQSEIESAKIHVQKSRYFKDKKISNLQNEKSAFLWNQKSKINATKTNKSHENQK